MSSTARKRSPRRRQSPGLKSETKLDHQIEENLENYKAIVDTPFSSPLDTGIGHDRYLIFFYRPHFIIAFVTGAGVVVYVFWVLITEFSRTVQSFLALKFDFFSQFVLDCILQHQRRLRNKCKAGKM